MADGYEVPDHVPMVDGRGMVSLPWAQLLSRWQRVTSSLTDSGTTAQRPTSALWIGRTFFDTTLGKPVWVKQVRPAVVWVDAAGTVA